jgi:hypothetical protein
MEINMVFFCNVLEFVNFFLQQLEHEDSNEVPERPGFGTDPDPNFKSEQKTSYPKEHLNHTAVRPS